MLATALPTGALAQDRAGPRVITADSICANPAYAADCDIVNGWNSNDVRRPIPHSERRRGNGRGERGDVADHRVHRSDLQTWREVRQRERERRRAIRRAQQQAHRGASHRHHHRENHHGGNTKVETAIIAGVLGLAAGAIIANEAGKRKNRHNSRAVGIPLDRIYEAPRAYRALPRSQVAKRGANGWIGSPNWLRYCTERYRSFNPQTGKFLSYSGQYKLCR